MIREESIAEESKKLDLDKNVAELLSVPFGRKLRGLLLDLLQVLSKDGSTAAVVEQELSKFFKFTIDCLKEGFLKNEDILTLFEEMYECCQESWLKTLFPLFERAIHGGQGEEGHQIKLVGNQIHACTKICRIIMTKLTVTHDLQLRGALLQFVARTLPLTHESGKKSSTTNKLKGRGRAR